MTKKTKIISVVFVVLILAGATYFAINSYQNAKMDQLNSELFLTKPSNLSTYEDLYRYLTNTEGLTMEEISGYRADITMCEKNGFPVEQTELYKDLWMKNIAKNPELKEYCDKNPEILGINMDKDWMK
jgi:hypothetical protein